VVRLHPGTPPLTLPPERYLWAAVRLQGSALFPATLILGLPHALALILYTLSYILRKRNTLP
jgi:hypothetical protein